MNTECTTTYYVEFRDWSGDWCRHPAEFKDSTVAVDWCRDWLATKGYSDVGLRVIKVHTCRKYEVLQEVTK